MATPDLYEILGVPRNASAAAIKAAFRRRAMDFHPDHGGDPEEFHRIKHAYDVLTEESEALAQSKPEAPAKRVTSYDIVADPAYWQSGSEPENKMESENERFETLLGNLLLATIGDAGAPEFFDIVDMTRESIKVQLVAIDRQVTIMSRLKAKIDKVRGRLHGPGGDDVLQKVLAKRAELLNQKIDSAYALKEQLRQVQGRLDLYSYDTETDSIV